MKNQTAVVNFTSFRSYPACLRLILLLCLLGSAMAVQAGTFYFLGNGNGTGARGWTNNINWTLLASGGTGGALPVWTATDNDLVFGNYHTTENTLRADNGGAFFSAASANAHSLTFTCNGWLMQVKGPADKIILGSGGITNNVDSVTGTPTSGAVPTVNAFRNYLELSANATIWNYDTNFQLTIRQDAAQFGAGNMYCLDLKTFTLTFDGPGTNNFNTITAGTHAGGALKGTGGLIKNGTGATTFGATNSYTGSTVINAGLLGVRSMCNGGGAYTVANGATLQVTMNSPNQSLNVSSLNVTSTTTNSLTLGVTSSTSPGNPTAPVIYATNLTLNGTIYVTVTGSGLTEGTIPLIQYNGSIAGGGTLVTNTLPSGIGAYLTNNTVAKQWQLVVTSVPNLVWVGRTNSVLAGNWDLSGTTNWLNTDTGLQVAYANGLPVQFDDTGFTNLITLVTNVTPSFLIVSNNAKTYTLTNNGLAGYQANPSSGLIKDGPGLLIIGNTNSYTTYTAVKQGTLRTTIANAIGRAPGNSGAVLTNNATLDLNGFSQNIGALYGSGVITNSSSSPLILSSQAGAVDGGTYSGRIDEGVSGGTIQLNKASGVLKMSGASRYSGGTHFITGGAAASRQITLGGNNVLGTGPVIFEINSILSADSSPRTLTNSISIQNVNAGLTLGATGAGLMTLSGPFDINATIGGDQSIFFASDVALSGPFTSTSGGFSAKDGPATLRLLNNTVNWANINSDSRISDGTMIIDGANVTVSGATIPNFRVQSLITNGVASLYITNGGSLTVGTIFGYGRVRLGDTTSAPGSTNIADIRGTLIADGVTIGYSNTNNTGGGKLARLNLQPGSQLTVSQISPPSTNCTAITEINLDGATINVPDSASSSFLQGMTNVFVKSGGVTLNGSNTNSIHIRQNLLSGGGSGGLTWNGTNTAVPASTQLQLDGTNTYTGTTLINVGIMGGVGTLASPVVMASGTKLFPGGGGNLGTLTVNSSFTMSNGVICSFELNTTNSLAQTDEFGVITNYVRLLNTNDMLVVSGTLNIAGGTINVNNNGTNLVLGDTFKLFNQAAVGFTNVNLPTLDAGLAWQNNLAVDGSIKVVVPTTTPPTLSVSQTGNVLNFTWTDASFHLQSQTNALGVGLNTNWSNYPGGGSSPVGVTINPANPSVFFRLSQ